MCEVSGKKQRHKKSGNLTMETNICAVFNERDCLKIDSLNAISIISKIANTPLDSVMEIRKLRWVINKCSLELEKKSKRAI